MELKSLEIYGFKSFASRTKIKFNRGITGIVGPNGSGKSNIVDAIMWGLGVQSAKQLRGQKMEDVIFAGTSKKKPLNFAEVILTFDNSSHLLDIEYEEVSIKRKIYRSGESEFSINGQKVRLRDIQELFMDTGVGRDGYSFIGQGQIDGIINSKPVDRRQVFEEAAGITKYKKRKEESIRSLQKTEENLQRLSDILSEIKTQHEHLKVESERTGKYQGYKRQRDISNGSFLFLNLNRLKEKSKESKIKLEDLIKDREQYELELNKSFEQVEELSKTIHEKKDQDQELQDQRLLLTQEFQSTKSKIENTKDLTKRMTLDHSNLESEKLRIEEKLEDLAAEIAKSESESMGLHELLVQREEEFTKSKNQFHKDQLKLQEAKEKLSVILEDQQSVHINRTQLESKIDAYRYMINERSERLIRLEEMSRDLKGQFKELEAELEMKKSEKLALNRNFDDLSLKNESTDGDIRRLNQELEAQQTKSEELSNRRETLVREMSFLKKMQENHEGYSSAVKRFLKIRENQSWASTVVGTVAESIHIIDPFQTAISTALGGAAQNIILEDDRAIGEMIKVLKNHKMGRVTFLPLNTIKPSPIKLNSLPKVDYPTYLASDCVKVPENLKVISEFLLGRILVVESLEYGRDLSRRIKSRYRIVTLDGQVFNVGGSITGGSQYQGQRELFNRKSQITTIDQEIKNLTYKLGGFESEINKLNRELEAKSQLLSEISLEKNKNVEDIQLATQSIDKYTQTLNDLKNRQEELRDEIQRENDEISSRSKMVDEMVSSLESSHVAVEQEEVAKLTDWVNVHEVQLNETRDSLAQDEINLAKDQSNLEFSKEQIKNLEENTKSYRDQVQSIITKEDEIQRELGQLRDQERQLEENYQSLDEKLKVNDKSLVDIRSLIQNLEGDIETLQKSQQETQVKLRKLERKEENLTLKYHNLKEEFEITSHEFNQLPESIRKSAEENEVSLEKLKQIIREMDANIESLGYINFNAIEEFKEIDDRYQFNLNQQEDLYLSKDKLEGVIQTLDREMTKVFKATIQEVQVYFEEVFEQLFQGGHASIELVNEEDILESGIEIIAQPPGKKLQSLTLLSGGERSMTAVALLFALLRKRKSPFCILDEIDAALDEANIARYTNYLKNLDDIQFIMITHRKSTMEIAESLYGITMEEKGISSVISMKLEE